MPADDDFLEGVEELIADDAAEDGEYARTFPALLAVHAAERAAHEMEGAIAGKADRWWFAITDAHQALTAALVEALSGTAGIGALTDEDAKEWLRYYETSRSEPNAKIPREGFIATFHELLKRAQNGANKNDMHGTLILSEQEQEDLKRLNQYRNDLDHVKPRYWSLQTAGLPRVLGAAAAALGQLFGMDSLQYELEPADLRRAEEAIGRMLRIARDHPSAP